MRNVLLTLLLALPLCVKGQEVNLPELYREIDEAIEESPKYVADYEERISEVRTALRHEKSAEKRLRLTAQLFEMNKAYDNDSALAYIQQYIDLADQLGRHQEADQGRALMAFQLSTVGLYTESLGILNGVNSGSLTQEGKVDYYVACLHVCGELAYYTKVAQMRDYYYRLQNEFRDSLFQVADPGSETYLLRREMQLMSENKFDEALKVNDRRMQMVKEGTHDYAIVCYYRHLIFNELNKQDLSKYWLAQSALCDVRNAVMDQASLISLAERLNSEGDLERSYNYIQFTWRCNSHFNTRMRSWQISPIITVIGNNYEREIKHNSHLLTGAMAVVSVLALLLLAALFFVHRRHRQLDATRAQLAEANQQLTQSNAQLATQANELLSLNAELSTLNTQLKESNQVKEEYIGRFMSLCSQYINKLDDYRKMVNRKMKNKELDELFRISKSTELKEKELEELYENFDSVFLHLFPTFVDDFNALLQPEVQIHPKEENRLTTDIRIFALIRLGIEDSSKIAEFLHYSVNTIYNYRARIKNGVVGSRESFEQQVKLLGLPR